MQSMHLVTAALLVLALANGVSAKLFEQNCASRGLCRVPLDLRPPALHAVDPSHPKGHLKPLGHPDFDDTWDGELDEFDDDIDPELFWTKYYPHRPFVMRGVGKKHPAYRKWKDDKYLSENFGQMKVKCENKNEDRLTDYCGDRKMGHQVQCPRTTLPYVETYMNISKFLSQYRQPDHDTYAISQLPTDMAGDVLVSPAWHCGSRPDAERKHSTDLHAKPWKTQLYETNLWINYNQGKNFSSSVIHYDMNHQMMCLYDGEKEWFYWDLRKNIQHIPTWSSYYSQQHQRPLGGSDDSPIDGERVDLLEYPQFANARWTNTTLRAGDCMYTPAHIMHYVRSTGRNIAGMYMFQTETKYDAASCPPAAKTEASALDQYDVLWEFPGLVKDGAGYNQVKMGYPNWKRQIREPMVQRLSKKGKLMKKDIIRYSLQLLRGEMEQDEVEDEVSAVFAAVGAKKSVPEALIYNSPVFDEFFRILAVTQEGERPEQEIDTRVLRYDLIGKNAVKEQLGAPDKTREAKSEL